MAVAAVGEQKYKRWKRKCRKKWDLSLPTFFLHLAWEKINRINEKMYFVPRRVTKAGQGSGEGLPRRCLFVEGKCLCRCGEVSGLARAVCYRRRSGLQACRAAGLSQRGWAWRREKVTAFAQVWSVGHLAGKARATNSTEHRILINVCCTSYCTDKRSNGDQKIQCGTDCW